jgi:asparagine N-glycosylation enzyme membrane subunit Stt3
MEDIIEERSKKVAKKLNLKQNWYWGIFIVIAYFGYWIRTRNLGLLIDSTTGKYIPMALDPYAFLKYIKFAAEYGSLMNVDYSRYVPWGFGNLADFRFLANVIVSLQKILNVFSPGITIEKVHVLYPAIAFLVGLVFFFLLVKKLFDYRVSLLATFFLATTPAFLHRTMAGFSDKESLALAFMFAAFYFFVVGWKSKKLFRGLVLSGIGGIFTGLMGMIWGGVTFAIASIAGFVFIKFVFIKYKTKDFYNYSVWFFSFLTLMFLTGRYQFAVDGGITHVIDTAFALYTFLVGLTIFIIFKKNLFKIKNKITSKIPEGVAGALITGFLGLFIFRRLTDIFITLTNPFGQSRWALTVAEAHQPYLIDLIGSIGWKFFIVMLIGAIVLFHKSTKSFNSKWKITSIFTVFMLGFVFNRYRSDAKYLNGDTNVALFAYLGFALLFGLFVLSYYLYSYKKDKDLFDKFKNINGDYIFILIWFLVMIVAVRSANRLIFVFPVVGTIISAYLLVLLFDYSLKIRKNWAKIGIWVLLFLVLLNPLNLSADWGGGGAVKSSTKNLFDRGIMLTYPETSIAQARSSGPGYNIQWQRAMSWIRENTDEPVITVTKTSKGLDMQYDGPVFAHWWDYGYWVQTGGERATVTDGGNAKGSLNHMMGRHFLTAQNDTEALEFLKAHNVTHTLIISDEIGKYPAFSSIGADSEWDRYSWIQVFSRDDRQVQETRDGTVFVFTGGSPLDWDFEYNNKIYPKSAAGIAGVFVPTQKIDDNSVSFLQPSIVVIYNDVQETIPLKCLYVNGEEINFEGDGYDGCFFILPSINGQNVDNLGNGLMVSEKVKKTLFYRHYLIGKENEYFKLVHDDSDQMPLALFNGRIIGPLKIWEVSYPEDLEVPEIYYFDKLPDPKVNSVEGRF